MNDQELITTAYTHWLDIGNTDADETVVRDRIRLHGDQSCQRFFAAYPWPWKQTSDTLITALAADDGYVAVPDDFQTFGSQGSLTVDGKRSEVRWMAPQDLFLTRRTDPSTSTVPRFYTLSDTMGLGGSTSIVLWPRPSVNVALRLDAYERKMPLLVDAAPPAPPAHTSLEYIPAAWHYVILDGIIARLMEDEGDGRAPTYEARFMRGIATAWNEERPGRHQARRGARYGRGQRGAWR